MKSFVILQRAFVSLLCDSPRVFESSRWSRSDIHRLRNMHEDAHTHTNTHRHPDSFTGQVRRLSSWCRSTRFVTYREMIMSFLAICLLLSCLLESWLLRAAWQLHGSWHVYKWKSFTAVFPILCILSVGAGIFGNLKEQMYLTYSYICFGISA